MKNFKLKTVLVLLVGVLLAVSALGFRLHASGTILDETATETTESKTDKQSESKTDKNSDSKTGKDSEASDEDTDSDEFEFTKTKDKLKCGKSFTFETNRSDVTWSVSNEKKATISKDGKLNAKMYGKVRVTATSGDDSISTVVKLSPKQVIGIDPGHQSRGDSSTEPVGPGSSTMKAKVAGGTSGVSTGKPEYQLTLEVGLALRDELKNRGYKVVMTRTTNDVNISNKERAEKLNKSCDVAVRLHADGGGSSAKGASVLYPSKNNPYIASLSADSEKLSRSVITSYCESTGIGNRGLSQRDDLTGTNWSTIPVTLIEMGFMTNSSEDNYMASSDGQAAMVTGIANGIDDYFK